MAVMRCVSASRMRVVIAARPLAGEARHQIVVAPAPANRAEPHRLALVVGGLKKQLRLEDCAGVIFKPADDRRIKRGALGPDAQPG